MCILFARGHERSRLGRTNGQVGKCHLPVMQPPAAWRILHLDIFLKTGHGKVMHVGKTQEVTMKTIR